MAARKQAKASKGKAVKAGKAALKGRAGKPRAAAVSKAKARPKKAGAGHPAFLLLSTMKGLWFLESDPARRSFTLGKPHFFGCKVHHAVLDPRDGRTILAAVRTGHLGPTVYRSTDLGATWVESARPPAFPKAPEGTAGRVVDHTFWLTPGHDAEPGVWFAGTSPQGLFKSVDAGATWEPVRGFNDHPDRKKWCWDDKDGTPDGPKLHSILVDPRDPRHMYISMSGGGTFETLDGGKGWKPLNGNVLADFFPEGAKYPEYGQDPHCMILHPLDPDRLYQQNHCGIYRLDRPGERWERIGSNMPKEVGDIGFPIVAHPRDPDTVWVVPMDGSTVWPRTSVAGRPCVFMTRDGGKSWKRQDRGLPAKQAWFTVYRQALAADAADPVGLYFGTTGGEVWASTDEGASWRVVASHLPKISAVVSGRKTR